MIKNKDGQRLFNPDSIKEGTAKYYQELYRKKPILPHPYYDQVKANLATFAKNNDYESQEFNNMPTMTEISEIIARKKNGKSTTDIYGMRWSHDQALPWRTSFTP